MKHEYKFYGLTGVQEDVAVDLYENNKKYSGSYTLEEVDDDMLDTFIENADADGDENYLGFLTDVVECDAELYTLTDHWGDFSQPIGEIAVFDY
jgi:hypothetical protein